MHVILTFSCMQYETVVFVLKKTKDPRFRSRKISDEALDSIMESHSAPKYKSKKLRFNVYTCDSLGILLL